MAEIYTLSGSEFGDVSTTPPSSTDIACAEKAKPLLLTGGVAKIAGVGVGLFGTYKLLKGKGAAGITSVIGALILWGAGTTLISASARGFDACRKG